MKNSSLLHVILSSIAITFSSSASLAQILIEDGQGQSTLPSTSAPVREQEKPANKNSGEGAARQYFIERKQRATQMGDRRPSSESSGGPRFMAIQVGTFVSDKQHRWGDQDHEDDVGELILGVSYRMGQWTNSMDMLLRAEINTYDIDGETTKKLSIMPVITFPDVDSDFPLYFGAGLGVGVFLDQVDNESDLSVDYSVLTGVRFLNLWENGGLVAETGIKGHVHIVSSGQFNGVFLTMGAAFTF